MSESLVTSQATSLMRPPARTISRPTSAIAARSRPFTATSAPWAEKALAIAAPMPRELPVTRATLPFRSVIAGPRCDAIVDHGLSTDVTRKRHAQHRDHEQTRGDPLGRR